MGNKIYIQPEIKLRYSVEDVLMEVISLPTTGQVNNPSSGQAREFYDDLVEEETTFIKFHSVWDE